MKNKIIDNLGEILKESAILNYAFSLNDVGVSEKIIEAVKELKQCNYVDVLNACPLISNYVLSVMTLQSVEAFKNEQKKSKPAVIKKLEGYLS